MMNKNVSNWLSKEAFEQECFLEVFFPLNWFLSNIFFFLCVFSLIWFYFKFQLQKILATSLDKIEISIILVFVKSKLLIPEDDALLITLL